MTDKFTLNLTYDRDAILADVQKVIDLGGDIYAARRFLDQMYPAWHCDLKTVCKMELMFRTKTDMFYDLYSSKLTELEAAEV